MFIKPRPLALAARSKRLRTGMLPALVKALALLAFCRFGRTLGAVLSLRVLPTPLFGSNWVGLLLRDCPIPLALEALCRAGRALSSTTGTVLSFREIRRGFPSPFLVVTVRLLTLDALLTWGRSDLVLSGLEERFGGSSSSSAIMKVFFGCGCLSFLNLALGAVLVRLKGASSLVLLAPLLECLSLSFLFRDDGSVLTRRIKGDASPSGINKTSALDRRLVFLEVRVLGLSLALDLLPVASESPDLNFRRPLVED